MRPSHICCSCRACKTAWYGYKRSLLSELTLCAKSQACLRLKLVEKAYSFLDDLFVEVECHCDVNHGYKESLQT